MLCLRNHRCCCHLLCRSNSVLTAMLISHTLRCGSFQSEEASMLKYLNFWRFFTHINFHHFKSFQGNDTDNNIKIFVHPPKDFYSLYRSKIFSSNFMSKYKSFIHPDISMKMYQMNDNVALLFLVDRKECTNILSVFIWWM
jgi:hypothetical protein